MVAFISYLKNHQVDIVTVKLTYNKLQLLYQKEASHAKQ